MINKILNYIKLDDEVLLIFFKDNSSITVDIKTGAIWGHKTDGSRMHDLPDWAFNNIIIENRKINDSN